MSENADAFNTWDQICLVFFEKSEFSFIQYILVE